MNQENAMIRYEPVMEMAFPRNIFFKDYLRAEYFVKTKTTGLFKGNKEGLFHVRKGQLLAPEYDSVDDAGFGTVLAKKGRSARLFNGVGVQVAGEECSAVKVLSKTLFAKMAGKRWGLYRLEDGAEILPCRFREISEIKNDTFVLTDDQGARIVDMNGNPVLPDIYKSASPFVNNFARVGMSDGIAYISREGNVIYSGAGPDSRDFCNGYAVIADKKGRLGAIDTTGRVIVSPQYLFLKDFGDGFFVCSNDGVKGPDGNFSGRNFGAINGSGKMIIQPSKLFIAPRGDGNISFGRGEVWQVVNGNTRTAYRVGVMGVADCEGNIILPEKYVSIGNYADGLAPFKSLEGSVMTLGYMRPDGSCAFVVARQDYKNDNSARPALRADLSEQLGAFVNGKARVSVCESSRTVGLFTKTVQHSVEPLSTPRYIDINGNETTPPENTAVSGTDSLLLFPGLPFAEQIRSMNESERHNFVKILPFSNMIELTAGQASFAIFDGSGQLLCAKWDGTNLRSEPQPRHNPYTILQELGSGLWLGAKIKPDGKTTDSIMWVSEFESPTVFGDGIAPFRVQSGSGWLWGYTDIRGQDIVPPRYSHADGFNYGKAYAKLPDGTEVILSHHMIEDPAQ